MKIINKVPHLTQKEFDKIHTLIHKIAGVICGNTPLRHNGAYDEIRTELDAVVYQYTEYLKNEK